MAAVRTPRRRALGENLDETFLANIYDAVVFRRLLAYVWRYKPLTFISLGGMALYILTTVGQPLIIAWGIDSYIAPGDGVPSNWGSIHLVGSLFAANALGTVVGQFIQLRAMARVRVNVLYDLRVDMFDHLQRQSITFFDRNEVGRIMSRVQNDTLSLQEFLDVGVVTIADVFMLLFIAVTLFVLDPILAMVTFAVTPILLISLIVWQRVAKPTFIRIRSAISAVNGNLQESITGVRVTQSMNRQSVNLGRFDRLNTEHLLATVKGAFLSGALMPVVELVTAGSLAVVIIVGGLRVLNGDLEIGFLIAFLLYVQRFFDPIRTLTMQFTQFQRAMASGARIFDLLDIVPESVDKPHAPAMPPVNGHIKFDDVSFAYVPDTPVLQHINLDIQAGETVAFIGLTGAGKSTLVSLVNRTYIAGEGQVLVDGINVGDITRDSLVNQTSMVLQEPFLYSESITDNIRYNHKDVTDQQIVAASQAVGAHDFISKLPDGYDTILEQRGGNLSMGQRQLVSMARAIVNDPRILILDEATANMDSETERLLQEALNVVFKGRTSLIIAHRLSTITGADKIVVLELGRIIEVGSHQELLEKKGLYSRLYEMNFREPE